MNVRQNAVPTSLVLKALAGVLVGLGVGTLVPPNPVTLPALGAVPAPAVGVPAVIAGGAVYLSVPRLVASDDCGCAGECGCS